MSYRHVAFLFASMLVFSPGIEAKDNSIDVEVGSLVNLQGVPACVSLGDLNVLLTVDHEAAKSLFKKLLETGRCQRLPDRAFRVKAIVMSPRCPATAQNIHGVDVPIACLIIQDPEGGGLQSTFVQVVSQSDQAT